MKKVLFCLMMLWSVLKPCEGFGQSEGLVDSVNKVIGPEYYLDSTFGVIDSNYCYSQKQFIVRGYDTSTGGYKIFILQKENNKFIIFDEYPDLKSSGWPPKLDIDSDLLSIVDHNHFSGYDITYK